ncbi:MAG: LamG-like jellyroll fold domain-containing protein, partial [Planctomycetota bacterium]
LWTQRLMGHWKFQNTITDSVTGTVTGAPVHNGSMVTHDTIIGVDFGGGSTNNFNDITGDGTIASGSVIDTGNAVVSGVSVTISGLTWSDYNGHDNGGLPYPFDYSNVDDWAGSSSGDPVTITFTGLNDSKTYDFTLHAGWLGGINQAMRVSSSDGKVSSVIDTTPTGAPNIATITAASPTGTVLQFTVQTTNGTDTVMNAAALTTSTPAVSPAYDATGIDGSSIQFNNENAYVEIADPDYFNFYPLGFTASVWYKANTAVGWRIPFSKISVDPRAGWLFGIDDTVANDVSLIIEGGGAWISSGPDVDYGDGQWHLMTATYDPAETTMSLYSDGDFVVQSLVDLSLFALASDPVSIGGRFGEHAVSGSIDDARIYSYPLSAIEVAELYTNLKPGESVCVKETDAVFESLDQVDDCQITLADFAVFAGRWLDCMLIPAGACSP